MELSGQCVWSHYHPNKDSKNMLDYTTGVQQKPYSPDRIETEVIQLTESHFMR